MKRNVITLFIVLFIPLLFQIYWKHLNTTYPLDDQAHYIGQTQRIYASFKTKSFTEAIAQLYLQRLWKPILHPAMGVPFLLATQGDVRLASDLYSTSFFLLLLSLVYLYLSRHIRKSAAALGTILISLLPWVFGVSTNFNSELTFLTAILGFVNTAESALEFSESMKPVKAALWLSFALCLRPVETLLVLSLPILSFCIGCFKKNNISKRDFGTLLVWIILAFSTFYFPFFKLKRNWQSYELAVVYFLITFFFTIFVIFSKKLRLNKSFQLFFGITGFLTIFWYAPFAWQLCNWIFVTNFASLAIETGNRVGKPVIDFYLFYLHRLGIAPLVLSVVAIMAQLPSMKQILNAKIWLFLTGIILVPLLAGTLTYNGDVRYYYSGWLIICMLLIRLALTENVRFYKLRYGLLTVFSAYLFCNLLMFTHDDYRAWDWRDPLGGSHFPLTPTPDVGTPFQDNISNYLEKPGAELQNIWIFSDFSISTNINWWPLSVIAKEKGLNREYSVMNLFEDWPRDHILLSAAKYIIVGPVEAIERKYDSEMNKMAIELFSKCMIGRPALPPQDLNQFEFTNELSFEIAPGKFGRYCLFKRSNGDRAK